MQYLMVIICKVSQVQLWNPEVELYYTEKSHGIRNTFSCSNIRYKMYIHGRKTFTIILHLEIKRAQSNYFQSFWPPKKIPLRWLKTFSSTKILMGCYSHSLSLAATIMVSKNCSTIGEHVVVLFIT